MLQQQSETLSNSNLHPERQTDENKTDLGSDLSQDAVGETLGN